MFYRLKANYVLRGWNKMSWVLVERPWNKVRNLSQEEFQVLLLCDGETELDKDLLSELEQTLRQCEEKGWVEKCEFPQPLEQDQRYQYYRNRYVHMVFWSITGKCNFRCRHCYMDAPDAALGELSTEEALDLIDQMAACGVLRVDITGGEPFVRRDFWQLVDRMVSHKITIGMVYTNGWLLDDKVLDGFECRSLKPEFSLSFDGVGWHDWMRGISGAEKAALRAMELCRDRGFRVNAEMCVHRGNRNVLPSTVDVLRQAGVHALKISGVTMTDLWRVNNEGNALTREEYLESMLEYIPRYYEAGCPMEIMLGGMIHLHPDGHYELLYDRYDGTEAVLQCHLCGTVRWSSYLTPEGRLLPCIAMTASAQQTHFPKVREIGLQQGLSDSYYMQFVDARVKDLLAVNQECAACEYRFKCGGGCRAGALLADDYDLMGCDRGMCTLLKGGYAERIRQAADQAIAAYGMPLETSANTKV